MFNTEQQRSDHPQQSSLPPSTSLLREHNSEVSTAECSSPPSCATIPCTHPPIDVGFVGVPEQQQFISPVNQGNNQFDHAHQREIPCPAQAAVPYPSAHHTPPLGPPTVESLRQLANRYVYRATQVDGVCIEQTPAGRYKVTIALEVTDLL